MCGRLQTQDLSRTPIAQPPPGVPPPPDDTSSLYNLVWYDDDQNPINGRPDHGGWWLRNPNGRGIVPNDGNIYRTATPLLGTYDATDPAPIRQHAYWFAAMGASGIINDWTNINFSTLPAYSEGVERATHTLMTEFSQANGNHPHLKVVIAVRIQAAASDTAVVLDRVAALYNQFPACTVRLNNGTPTSTRPLLEVFTNFTPISAWRVAPQFSDERFDIRFTNGYLTNLGLTVPLGPGAIAKVANDLPYWNFVENSANPTKPNYYQTVLRNFVFNGVERTEQSAAWVAIHRGGMNWDGIGANAFERSIDPFFTLGPQVLVLNRFNYAIGWYAQPQEGLSADTATMIEPSEEYGYRLFNQATQYLSRIRSRAPSTLGELRNVDMREDGAVYCAQGGWPLEYQVSANAPLDSAPWNMVVPVDGVFVVAPPHGATQWLARTRNSFGESPWTPLGTAPPGQAA